MKIKYLLPIILVLIAFFSWYYLVNKTGTIKDEVWNTVKTINRHWAITENMDSLGLYIHPDMVLINPETAERMQGKSDIIKSYRSYADYAQTISLKESDPLILLYNGNETAIVTYYYDLKIKDPGEKLHRFKGRDMYTLIRDNGQWLAVAQHFSPMPN